MAIDWIKSYSDVENHPKTVKLRKCLRWNLDETIGFLHRFWWRASRICPDGIVTELCQPEVLEESFGYKPGAGSRIIAAMVQVGWLDREDGKITIHAREKYCWKRLSPTIPTNAPTIENLTEPNDIIEDEGNQQKTPTNDPLDKIRRDKNRKETTLFVGLSESEITAAANRTVDFYSQNIKPRNIDNSGSKKRFIETAVKLLKAGVSEADLEASIQNYRQALNASEKPGADPCYRKGFQSFFGPREDLWKDYLAPVKPVKLRHCSNDNVESIDPALEAWAEDAMAKGLI